MCVHNIQDCLPVCLMFDMREDGEADPCKLAQMMQNLGVFISVKPKVKQTSKVNVHINLFFFLSKAPHRKKETNQQQERKSVLLAVDPIFLCLQFIQSKA